MPTNQPPSYRQYLNNLVKKRMLQGLTWEYTDKFVLPNDHFWTATIQLNGTTVGKGTGWKKGDAEEKAAMLALEYLEQNSGN